MSHNKNGDPISLKKTDFVLQWLTIQGFIEVCKVSIALMFLFLFKEVAVLYLHVYVEGQFEGLWCIIKIGMCSDANLWCVPYLSDGPYTMN